jgi:hypothetical protein
MIMNRCIDDLFWLLVLCLGGILLGWMFKKQLTGIIRAEKKCAPSIFYAPQPKCTILLGIEWLFFLMCCLSLPLRLMAMFACRNSMEGAVLVAFCFFAFVFNLVAALFHRPHDYRPAVGSIIVVIMHGWLTLQP